MNQQMRSRLDTRLRPMLAIFISFAIAILASACRDTAGSDGARTSIAVLAGDAQFGTTGTNLSEQLQVVVTDAVTKEPREGIRVDWTVVDGGASVTPPSSTTDTRGIATTTVRLGATLGTSHIRATAANQVGDAALFNATAVEPPAIVSLTPSSARAGDTITITGSNFGGSASALTVTFDGIRGAIASASSSTLRVVVPACVTSHTTSVRVSLGSIASAPASLATIAGTTTALRLARGQVRVFADPADLQCVRLPPDPAGASYLIIPQNAADEYSIPMPFELTTLAVSQPLAARSLAMSAAIQGGISFSSDWELALRARERIFAIAPRAAAPSSSLRTMPDLPKVGDRRAFNTLNAQNQTVKITAEVKAVTAHAILYQDIAAPAIYTVADYERLGATFDDPIYDTDTSVFGAVGDIDNNGRVIMVFTPQVNALTPKNSGSFIAGYFYACDLVSKDRCTATNSGEIFYALVPDPNGQFSSPHSAASVTRTLPPVLAHEFMHMINFSQRSGSLDVLWLGEALAHTAEDIVGQVFIDRGDPATGAEFIEQNHSHARLYLGNTMGTSLIADESPGTIALRGAGWLFLRYLRGLYGENALLRELTKSTSSGSLNITSHTGKTWEALMSDFAVAIYADDAPDLAGVAVDPRYTFVNTNMREMLGFPSWPLSVRSATFADLSVTGSLPSSAWQYVVVQGPSSGAGTSLNVVFAGANGGGFPASTVPRLVMMRLR